MLQHPCFERERTVRTDTGPVLGELAGNTESLLWVRAVSVSGLMMGLCSDCKSEKLLLNDSVGSIQWSGNTFESNN